MNYHPTWCIVKALPGTRPSAKALGVALLSILYINLLSCLTFLHPLHPVSTLFLKPCHINEALSWTCDESIIRYFGLQSIYREIQRERLFVKKSCNLGDQGRGGEAEELTVLSTTFAPILLNLEKALLTLHVKLR